MTLRGIPTPPGRGSSPSRTNNMPEVQSTSVSKVVDLTDYALISSLQSQLAAAQASLAQTQAALAVAQAQIVTDAATIAALNAQVLSLQGQVAALQAQLSAFTLFKTYFVGSVTEVGGGIYVPPSYDNPVIFTDIVKPPQVIIQVTTIGGGYP